MVMPRPRAPWWFLVGVAVVVGLVCRALVTPAPAPWDGGGHPVEVKYAFWAFIGLIAELIWKGIEVAGKITLEVLHWLYLQLSLIVTHIGNGLKTVGSGLLAGLKKAWEFSRLTYDKVLKPAWQKFWNWFDRFRKWLDDTFGPVLRFLRRVRDTLLDFWKRYVRPWLDIIDVSRRGLRVLNSLGLHWAGALDAKLGSIEDAIAARFAAVVARVNEVINLVNRVVTLDGLLQRVALIRSLARDYQFAWQAMANPYRKLPTEAEKQKALAEQKAKAISAIEQGLVEYMTTGGGIEAELYQQALVAWLAVLRAR